MESVRPTDEVYEGDHMGESSGYFGGGGGTGGWFLRFHIAACLFTPVHPRHCPQDDAFLTPIAKLPPPIPLSGPLSSPETLTHVFSGGAQTKRHPRDPKLFMHV